MLPDLSAMLGFRIPPSSDLLVTAGVALHHRTDAVFHETRAFVELSRWARVELSASGMSRGPARALAHIGTEILLDEQLGQDPPTEGAYLDALRTAASAAEGQNSIETSRIRNLAQRLVERGIARSLEPELVARRLRHALESHPRLRFGETEEPIVTRWVVNARPRVAARTDELLVELRGRLDP